MHARERGIQRLEGRGIHGAVAHRAGGQESDVRQSADIADQRPQAVQKHSTSQTTYTLRRKLSLLVNSVTSFSNAPLVSIFYVGLAISLLALVYICYLVLTWLYIEKPLSGWTSVMASIWLLGGMIISFIGIVGIYLSKIFSETKQRPYTIVRQVYARPRD